MSQTLNTSDVQSAVRALYAPVAMEMDRAEQRLRAELHNESPFVNELLEYGSQLGGKRLRPALLLLTAKATGAVTDEHYTLAAVVEMIHTATLVHDDVLDEAEMRRHLATVNSRWNNETSVLLGDYLFTHAFYLASTLETTFGCRRIGQSTNIVCEGELRQIDSRGNHGLSEEEYYAIIDGKTAELCACACHLGAHYAAAEANVVSGMERYGRGARHGVSNCRRFARSCWRRNRHRKITRHGSRKAKANTANHPHLSPIDTEGAASICRDLRVGFSGAP